jgi:hypothetical protein
MDATPVMRNTSLEPVNAAGETDVAAKAAGGRVATAPSWLAGLRFRKVGVNFVSLFDWL